MILVNVFGLMFYTDVKDAKVSSPQFDDFSVTTTSTDKDNEIKVRNFFFFFFWENSNLFICSTKEKKTYKGCHSLI